MALDIDVCYEVERSTLGSVLHDDIHGDVIKGFTGGRVRTADHFRLNYACRDERRYGEALINLFTATKQKFDWAKRRYDPRVDPEFQNLDALSKKPKDPGRVPAAPISSEERKEDELTGMFSRVCREADALQREKGKTYKNSWRKRGAVGVFHNMARKWDRIENIIEAASEGCNLDPEKLPQEGESLRETLIDLFVYTGKMITLLDHDSQ